MSYLDPDMQDLPPRGLLPTARALGTGPKLFTPEQIAVATFLGSAFTGGLLLALSHRRAKTGRGYQAILLGTLVTAATVLIGLVLGRYGGMALPVASVFVMRALARSQLPGIEAAVGGATQQASWLAAIGTAIATIGGAIAVAVVIGFSWVSLSEPPAVDYGHDQTVQYDKGATATDARIVGEFLQAGGFFTETGRDKTVRVERTGGRFVVSFVLQDGTWDKPEMVETFEVVRKALEAKLLGEHVAIHLCDDMMDSHRTLE